VEIGCTVADPWINPFALVGRSLCQALDHDPNPITGASVGCSGSRHRELLALRCKISDRAVEFEAAGDSGPSSKGSPKQLGYSKYQGREGGPEVSSLK